MQLLHAVLSAWEVLGEIRGEPHPCTRFTPLEEIPASYNLIVSFVSIVMSDHR